MTGPSSGSASDVSSAVQEALPNVSKSTFHNKAEKVENSVEADSRKMSSLGNEESKRIVIKADTYEAETAFENKEERSIGASSSESLPRFFEETVVYLDDIEEYQSSTVKNKDFQDQRFFKFKSSTVSKRVNLRNSCDRSYWERHELWTEKASSKGSQRNCILSRKRSRRRLVYDENQRIKDVECASYYGQPHKSTLNHKHRSYHKRKQQNKMLAEEGEERSSCDAEVRQKQICSREITVTPLTSNRRYYPKRACCRCCCDHESPRYFSSDEDGDDCEVSSRKQKNLVSRHCKDQMIWIGESNKETKRVAMPPKPRRRSYDNGAMVYDVFTYPEHRIHKQINELKGAVEELGLQGGRASFDYCSTKKDTEGPPYLRTVTMPPERSKDSSKDDFQRSNSCPVPYPNHVHPKLPDCDDLTARFMALKKENMLNKFHCRKQ